MDAVATTGLYPPANDAENGAEVDGLMQLAARAGTPGSRASYLQSDGQQQLIYRGGNRPHSQAMSYAVHPRPLETTVVKRDELGQTDLQRQDHPSLVLF